MLNFCRGRMLLGAVLALSSTTWAASGSAESYGSEKLDAIRPLSVNLVERYGATAMEESASRAACLYGLHVDSSSTTPVIEAHFSDAPLLSVAKDENTIAFELANTIVLNDLERMMIDGGNMLADVKVEQIGVAPHFGARLTVRTTEAFSAQVKRIGAHLRLTITAPDAVADARLAKLMDTERSDYVRGIADEYRARRAASVATVTEAFNSTMAKLEQATQSAKLTLLQAELANGDVQTDSLDRAIASAEADIESMRRDFSRHQMAMKQNNGGSVDAVIAKIDGAIQSMNTLRMSAVQKLEASTRIRAQVAQLSPAPTATADMAAFDRAMADVRSASAASTSVDSLSAFGVALETVGDASPALPVDEVTSAAIRKSSGDSGDAVNPPSKRTSPSVHSLTSPALDTPARMMTLNSATGASQAASDEGMLVMAQADDSSITNQSRPAPDSDERRRHTFRNRGERPNFTLYNEDLSAEEDPLRQLVNIDFKDMDLANVVALLANKGQINVIAGTEISGSVTANLKEIPLGRAIEIVLRMNGLGIVEEAGVYRITSYEEAVASRQDTEMIFLQTAEAEAVRQTLEEVTQASGGTNNRIRIGANTQSNIIVITGPRERVNELIEIIQELDVAEPVIPTVNRVIQLNYADPEEIEEIIEPILSENGQVTAEARKRQIIITDIPVKIEELSGLIGEIDVPEEQVSIAAMVVDKTIRDTASSGVNLGVLFSNDVLRDPFEVSDYVADFLVPTGDGSFGVEELPAVPEVGFQTNNLGGPGTGELAFGFVKGDVSLNAAISAEVQSGNAELLANPVIMTVENQAATINISDEIPFLEISNTGDERIPTIAFKDVGTILEVTPRVTFDRRIITDIEATQSTLTSFVTTGAGQAPVTAQRTASTTMRMNNGQTVYIAGLRRYDSSDDDTKVPVVGDIPLLGLLFKNQSRQKRDTELMVFLTCNIVEDNFPELTPYQKENYDRLGGTTQEDDMNVTRELLQGYYKEPLRDPIYKWRRPK